MAYRNDVDASGAGFFRRLLGAFHRDRRGTAMTEFVITLPVFIIIWVGMLDLYQVERESVRVKMEASHATWQNAMDVANSNGLIPPIDTGSPMLAASQTMGNISQYPSENGDWMAQLKNLGLLSNATSGEAKRATQPLSFLGQSPPGNVPGENLSAYPRDMVDDSRWNPITSAPGSLVIYAGVIPLSFFGPNQTPAAGMRYGASFGEAERSFTVGGRSRTYQASYDVLNTPVDKPNMLQDLMVVPGFSRLMAEEDPCLSNILEMSTDMGYMSNCL